MPIKPAARDRSMTFVCRHRGGVACSHCDRDLGMTYLLRDADGNELPYGRRCAARILGWPTNRVEMAAVQAERMAELDQRREAVFAEFPGLRQVWQDGGTAAATPAQRDRYMVLCNAVNEPHWWGSPRRYWNGLATWQDYLRHWLAELPAA